MERLNKIVVTDVKAIVTVFSPKGRFVEKNIRKSYGLSFCTQGQITYIHNGKKYISDSHNAIILPKNQTYSIHGDKTGTFAVINFECLEPLCDTMMLLPIENADALMKDFEQMKKLSLFEKNRSKIISIFYNIIYKLSYIDSSDFNILLPAIKYLENNYSSACLTNTMLAQQCSISEVYFRKLFIKLYGMTPRQFIIDTRINKAQQMLTEGTLKINAISEQCGFSNPYHFCRLFKQKTGLTPTEYMKRNKMYKI